MTETITASDLSCLTANLTEYLRAVESDPFGRIARSVRLAVRTDLPGDTLAFSHHRYSLGRLADGTHLAYRGTSDPQVVIDSLAAELTRRGQALVLAYSGAMCWSRARPTESAPHLVLVTARAKQQWHVSDVFEALLPDGLQEAYTGWISSADLLNAMTAPTPPTIEQRLRTQYAFGVASDVPRTQRFLWLVPAAAVPAPAEPPQWLVDTPSVLTCLSGYFSRLAAHPARERFIDDLWAAAQHHTFRYAHLRHHHPLTASQAEAVEAASAAWTALPMSLRFAADSARRGRPRPSLVATSFDALRAAESRCAEVLDRYGYTDQRQSERIG